MDEGPIIAQGRIELESGGPASTEQGSGGWPPQGSMFEDLLATEGGNLLAETLPLWVAGKVEAVEQDHALATYTKKFTDEDSRVDLTGDPYQQLLKIRTFDKNPRAHFYTSDNKRVIITEAKLTDGTLEIVRVIPEGKKEMPYSDFRRGQSA